MKHVIRNLKLVTCNLIHIIILTLIKSYWYNQLTMNVFRQCQTRMGRAIAVATLIVFSSLALVSINSAVHMGMDYAGMMADCPFMIYEDSLCQMTISEHIEHWQAIVTGITRPQGLALIGALFFSLFAFLFSIFQRRNRQRNAVRLAYGYYYLPQCQSYLSSAFADGILHPKIYQSVTA